MVISSEPQDAGRQTLLFAQQAKQQVLGADVIVPKSRPRLVLSQDHGVAGSLCKALKHAPRIPRAPRPSPAFESWC